METASQFENDEKLLLEAEIEAVKRDPRNVRALLVHAERRFAKGEHSAAVAILQTADRLAPGDFLINRTLSGFLLAGGQMENAETVAEKAVNIAPDSAEAALHLAGIQVSRGYYARAIPHLLAHVGHAEATPTGWHLLCISMLATGQPQKAIEAIRHAIRLQPANVEHRLHLASLLTSRARFGDALTELGMAAAISPADARILRAASGNHEALGDLAAAYQDAKSAANLAPDDENIQIHHDLLAKQLGLLGKTEDASMRDALADWQAKQPRRTRTAHRSKKLSNLLEERSRIIYALALRDMRTRYSQSHLGYFWAVFEPISHLLTLGVVFSLLNRGPPPVGSSLFEYYCTGLLPYLMFSHIANEVMTARASGGALLLLPKVRTTDIILAKTFLNLMTEIVVGLLVFSAFGIAGTSAVPAHLFVCVAAVALLALLGMGIGAINMVIRNFFHSWETFFGAIIRLLYFASGIYYSPIAMPDFARNLLGWNPILQGVELFRSGFYAEYNPAWIDQPYLIGWALCSLLLGFGLTQVLRRRLKKQA